MNAGNKNSLRLQIELASSGGQNLGSERVQSKSRSREEGFVLSPAAPAPRHLAIFTTYLRQVATFFPVALAPRDKENRNSYGKFYMRELELIIKYPLGKTR